MTENISQTSRWSYTTYRFILWAYMMNDIALVFSPADMSHSGFYIHSIFYTLFGIFIGIPLVYSEICIAQYTNYNIVSIWNFCPILRGVGYATVYLIILKTIYMMVLSTWYLVYAFHAALDPPPWFSCDEFDNTKCMVKRINVSMFQHCIEAQKLFDEDCGMKTASNFFFEREIGNNNTKNKNCMYLWKAFLTSFISSLALFIILLKKHRIVEIIVRILACFVCVVLLVLFIVALSNCGTWYAAKIGITLKDFVYNHGFYILTQGALTFGTGCGIIGYLSREVSFRSPATMTAVMLPLFSIFITSNLALIIFSGIKTMSYHHGEEENVIEVGDHILFNAFASVTETLSYFDYLPFWTFLWFSAIFACLFVNMSIYYFCLHNIITTQWTTARKYKKISCFILSSVISIFSWPFYCSDLAVALTDVTQIIQLTSSFFFSVGIYWIYGFQNHNVDIIFMIGVKASYFWKIAWVTNPIWLVFVIYYKWSTLEVNGYNSSYYIHSLSIHVDKLLFYFLFSLYCFIILTGILIELRKFYKYDRIRNVCFPYKNWGPQDEVLFRSRNMFVPEIMTREFLYRQVRIHGYSKQRNSFLKRNNTSVQQQLERIEWSALTSN